ncbi:hypothetical protein KL935_004138 [Ogataea polymorpha]|nr:hypothetical protein KL935_004138 [Ogataea polymorpha]KAG7907000.1 hypothetical protein KL906_004186 [Ogataea polymorpha]KAG7914653.1 hypothetical protein KL927_004322 [Ogataea polymorpha]
MPWQNECVGSCPAVVPDNYPARRVHTFAAAICVQRMVRRGDAWIRADLATVADDNQRRVQNHCVGVYAEIIASKLLKPYSRLKGVSMSGLNPLLPKGFFVRAAGAVFSFLRDS